jgi:hypothetical protein
VDVGIVGERDEPKAEDDRDEQHHPRLAEWTTNFDPCDPRRAVV